MRADARRNYEALVTAARELFLEQGCEAPLDEVARRAGVGAGTLYRHFPTRTDLLAAVYYDEIDSMCDRAAKLESEEPAQALSSYMDLHLETGLRNSGIKRAVKEMFHGDGGHPPALTMCKTKMTGVATDILARAQDAGAARKDVDGVTLLRMLHGIATACEDSPEMAPMMLQVMKDGLLIEDADA